MSKIETECPCGESHAAKFDEEPASPVTCDCGRVLRVLWRSLRGGKVVGQCLTVVGRAA